MVVNAVFFLEEKEMLVVGVGQGHGDFVLGLAQYTLLGMLVALEMPPVRNVLLLIFQLLGPVFDVVKPELGRVFAFFYNADDLVVFG
jgi:hypothetical protein